MALTFRRIFDTIYAVILGLQLCAMVLFDQQLRFPHMYPKLLQDWLRMFAEMFKDPFITNPPDWIFALLWIELVFYIPFLPIAIYAFLRGSKTCSWIRVPVVIFCSSILTCIMAAVYEIMVVDWVRTDRIGPSTLEERLRLVAVFAAFSIFYPIIIIDMSFFFTSSRAVKNAPKKNQAAKKAQ